MDLVLYHPQHGYYINKAKHIGVRGDFFTSPHLGADFGELLAEQFVEIWELLDRPNPFTLVEMGAGQGLLAQDVLRYLHQHHFECFKALNYVIVEKSAALIAQQRQQLSNLMKAGEISWQTWDEIPNTSIIGCCFSNELVDAFPVHQVVIQQGQLQEIYITTTAKDREAAQLPDFVEVAGELSTPRLTQYFDLVGIDLTSEAYSDGYRTEVNLAALDWLAAIASRLQRGYLLTIDYGYSAARYYAPMRDQGTLQCYYQHAHHSNPYIYIGQQDLTAHVDFTALERQGELCGLQKVGFTQQGLFLMALGLGDRLSSLGESTATDPQSIHNAIRRREALHLLMNPMGLGNFGVLIQSKGLAEVEEKRSYNLVKGSLRGLSMPCLST